MEINLEEDFETDQRYQINLMALNEGDKTLLPDGIN
jgi:hypothetical protein